MEISIVVVKRARQKLVNKMVVTFHGSDRMCKHIKLSRCLQDKTTSNLSLGTKLKPTGIATLTRYFVAWKT